MSQQDDDGQQGLVLSLVFGLVAMVIALVVGVSLYQRGKMAATPKTAVAAATTVMPANDLPNAAQNAMDAASVKVENGVQDLSGATILQRCYGNANFDPTAGFCRFVQRDANQALTVTSSFVNLSENIVKGYEFNGRYARDLFGGKFVLNANVTKYTEQSTRLFPEEFLTDANGIVTSPEWVGNFDANYTVGPMTVRYGLDWIGGDHNKTYNYFAFDNLTGITDPALVQQYRDNYFLEADGYVLHQLSVQFNVQKKYQFTFGVRNLLDTKPPRITSIGFTTIGNAPLYSGYDYVGRSFFANVNVKF